MLVSPTSPAERRGYWVLMAAVIVAHLTVLWAPTYNALVDYPAHLNRVWALYHYNSIPFFQAVFVRMLDPMANLAIDLIVPPLLHFMGPLAAGKIFLSLIVVLFAAGCHLLATTIFGRPSWMAVIATFAVFNSMFFYGFVNWAFSASLFLIALGFWMRYRQRRTLLGWLWTTLFVTATYIAHFGGFFFLALSVGVLVLMEWVRNRQVRVSDIRGFSVLLPGIFLQLYPWPNKVSMSGHVGFGILANKIVGLVCVFNGFHYKITFVTMSLLATAVGIVAMKATWRLDPTLLTLGLVFLFCSFISPANSSGGGWSTADVRFTLPGMVFLLLSFRVIDPPGIAKMAVAVALCAMMIRLADAGWTLSRASAAAERQMAALRMAEPNSRIYDLFMRSADRQTDKLMRGNVHLPCYSIILTQSVSSDFFGVRGAQPLCFRHPEDWVNHESPDKFDPAFLNEHLVNFDYVWGCSLDAPHRSYLEQQATLIATGDVCGLWKLKSGFKSTAGAIESTIRTPAPQPAIHEQPIRRAQWPL